jgi:hypothetical protein
MRHRGEPRRPQNDALQAAPEDGAERERGR